MLPCLHRAAFIVPDTLSSPCRTALVHVRGLPRQDGFSVIKALRSEQGKYPSKDVPVSVCVVDLVVWRAGPPSSRSNLTAVTTHSVFSIVFSSERPCRS